MFDYVKSVDGTIVPIGDADTIVPIGDADTIFFFLLFVSHFDNVRRSLLMSMLMTLLILMI